jgi:hypothetical protein
MLAFNLIFWTIAVPINLNPTDVFSKPSLWAGDMYSYVEEILSFYGFLFPNICNLPNQISV